MPRPPAPALLLAAAGFAALAIPLAAAPTPPPAEAAPWTLQRTGVTARLRGISAVSGSTAWASGANGTVLRTIDAGRTWRRLLVPDAEALDFRDIDALDDQTAWVLSIGPGAASRIYRTADGGATWERQFVNADPKAFFDGMAFWDADHGLAMSDAVDGHFVIIRTENGGRTWTPVAPAGLPPALPGEGAFAASGTSIAVAGRDHAWIGTGAAATARVLRSVDRGRTWRVAATPLPAGPSAGIFSIAFRDPQHGVIVGGDYKREAMADRNLAVTTDGGATWALPAASAAAGAALSGFRSAVAWMPAPDSAAPGLLAVGPLGSDVSRDGGRTWTALGAPGFHALSIAPDGVAWAAGEDGRIGRADLAALTRAATSAAQTSAPRGQTQADDYTSYELLAPDTAQFRILYDVTATTPGARYFFNPIRKGSVASDERVIDPVTGQPLAFEVVSGAAAREQGLPGAAADTDYIRVTLPRPVPANGEVRLRIDKTYKDAASYTRDGDGLVFRRSLGIRRNKIVLPAGFELTACNVPSQIRTEADGRLAVSFINANPGSVDLVVRARRLPADALRPAAPGGRVDSAGSNPNRAPDAAPQREPTLERSAVQPIGDRAWQDREIVYFLQPPDTHAFDLYHDYTEARPGTAAYVNVVRPGSRVSNPSAIDLDTGAALTVEILQGAAISAAKVAMDEPITAETEIVVIRFPAVKSGETKRLRISETYTDPARYGRVNTTLVWRRSFGRPRNALVLPAGWYVTASSMPATVSLTSEGRVRLDYVNGRPDNIDVLVRAERR